MLRRRVPREKVGVLRTAVLFGVKNSKEHFNEFLFNFMISRFNDFLFVCLFVAHISTVRN